MYSGGEQEGVSERWPKVLVSTINPNVSLATDDGEDHFCKLILYKEIADSRVRIWDVVILIPNLIFLIFIAARFNRARLKLRATSSPIFLAFYGLVISNAVISVIRCVVSMTINAAATVGGKVDKVLWVTVRFFLLSTELSVVIFGLAFGHLDSRSSIRSVLLATSFIALAFTITQGTLEFVLPDDTFRITSKNFYLFGHGGMRFWFYSSLVFTSIYIFILILPWTRLRERLALPTRRCFYIYAGTLATLDLAQSIGAGLLSYMTTLTGLCVVDLTSGIYLTLFTPLVYHTFLSEFFGVSQPSIMFSYKAQVDDAMDEDTVSLPHQQSFSSLKTDSDYIYQVHTPSIHMPLYDPDTLKTFSSKQRSSLYSLTPQKDTKIVSSSRSNSQLTLDNSPHTSKFDSHHSTLKATSNLGNAPMSMFDKSELSQKSTPNLSFDDSTWHSASVSKKNSGPNSISNLVFSPTASHFFYTPNDTDSNVNLFSPSTRSSLENVDVKSQESSSSDKLLAGSLVRDAAKKNLSERGLYQDSKLSVIGDSGVLDHPLRNVANRCEGKSDGSIEGSIVVQHFNSSMVNFLDGGRQDDDATVLSDSTSSMFSCQNAEVEMDSEESNENFIEFSPPKKSSLKSTNQSLEPRDKSNGISLKSLGFDPLMRNSQSAGVASSVISNVDDSIAKNSSAASVLKIRSFRNTGELQTKSNESPGLGEYLHSMSTRRQ